jgi:L-rhamnono-1,4-lactonase
MATMSIPIIDSHIHLFVASRVETYNWYSPSSPMAAQHSIAEYRAANSSDAVKAENPEDTTNPKTHLRGFVFLETDTISTLSPSDWQNPLEEVSFLTRIAKGEPLQGEGHTPQDKSLCLAIVPWAPVPGGPDALKAYMAVVKERTQTEDVWRKIRGVRYLAQSRPSGTLLGDDFVDGLKWLGRQGLTFDLGVDARQGGLWQLREAVEMMKRVYGESGSEGGVKMIISTISCLLTPLPSLEIFTANLITTDHLCKPNLHIPPQTIATHTDFQEWKSLITAMSTFPHTYMKLSGAFSELPSPPEMAKSDIIDSLEPWTDVVFDTFGPSRVMFASDWPVCSVNGGGNEVAWPRWRGVVETLLKRRGLSVEDLRGVWGGVAAKAYGLDV